MHVLNSELEPMRLNLFTPGKKVTVIGAISIKRVVALMTMDNSMDGKAFEVFTLKMFSPTIVVGSSSSDG